MRKILKYLLIFGLSGILCSNCVSSEQNELDTKSEYSVLQYYEFEYRNHPNSKKLIIKKSALNTKYNVFGLPKANSKKGYVWIIANPDSDTQVKVMPSDITFLMNDKTMLILEKKIVLAPDVNKFLSKKRSKRGS